MSDSHCEKRSVWERLVSQPFQPWDVPLDLADFFAPASLPGLTVPTGTAGWNHRRTYHSMPKSAT